MNLANQAEATARRAARTVLLDQEDRVLLIRYDSAGCIFWTTPGGAVEPGETDIDAAARELMEELQMSANLQGPVHSATSRFQHEGRYVENTDIFFAARTPATAAPQCFATSPFETQAMQHARWWSTRELLEASEDVFPGDLVEIIARVSPLLR